MTLPRSLTITFTLLLLITACVDDTAATTTTTIPTTTTTTTPPTTTSAPEAELDAQAAIDWFVSLLNGEEIAAEEYEARFNEEFRQQVPFEEGFLPILDQFRPDAPFTVIDRTDEGTSGNATIRSVDGTEWVIIGSLDDQGRFEGLFLQPADEPTLDDPPGTVEEAFARLAEFGTFRGLAAELVDGQCIAIESLSAGEPAPLGSAAKLYVLAALGEAVRSGEIAWDDEVEIRDGLKSLPSGILQDFDAGDTVTVLEAAELMISISDNTATDHLIDIVGREHVESVMADFGNTTPDMNTPFLDTRELFALKIGPAAGLAVQWLDGDEETRRAILDQIADITPEDLPVTEWTGPIEPDTIEWFATPDDLCTLAVLISDLADAVPEIGEILAINPGVPADPAAWEQIWFKGGSEPGLAAAWWVTENDGRVFVTAGSVVNPDQLFDITEAILLLAAARDLLAP